MNETASSDDSDADAPKNKYLSLTIDKAKKWYG
jgi:hypothetical protein